ncbi:hypothetical protein LNKW23_22720 [Paralimibaculum aggregatum]|uniref:DUF5082 domain-containing protein n=1 Tax=Paralimibaculum aggregatum TaxID=3036245 RepID=A0ABQ6LIF4_9RHOB|nr:hypothetical protein [Limibaculum sp. NKW23]GMG83059.1 hypothetical protein LNKW23_22720 [Limibaculum sp. NKW23]
MAIEDYAKMKTESGKLRKENTEARKKITKRLDDCAKKAEKLKTSFKDNQGILDTFTKRADEGYAAWLKVADEIIPLQTELKEARKRKDTAKVKDLEGRIAKLDRKAAKEADKVSGAVKEYRNWMVFVDDWATSLEKFAL